MRTAMPTSPRRAASAPKPRKRRAKLPAKPAAKSGAKSRAKPGTKGGGRFFHIELRPSVRFVAFRVQDVGRPGGVERVAGQRADGSWDTAKWLIEKTQAHLDKGTLVPDSLEAEKLLRSLGSAPVHLGGDRFRAKPRRDIPESEKPTPAMRRAQRANIKKAQAALRARRRAAAGGGTNARGKA